MNMTTKWERICGTFLARFTLDSINIIEIKEQEYNQLRQSGRTYKTNWKTFKSFSKARIHAEKRLNGFSQSCERCSPSYLPVIFSTFSTSEWFLASCPLLKRVCTSLVSLFNFSPSTWGVFSAPEPPSSTNSYGLSVLVLIYFKAKY